MDLIDDPAPGANAPEFTVSEISGAVKRVIEGEFAHVRIRGEVGRVSRPRSGHIYLDLKDDRACLAGVVWKGNAARLTTPPEEGMEVVATGRLTTFPGQSKYQIVIDDIRPAGLGALMAMLEKRKKALEAEGLFDASRKRPLPFLPAVIGVVTSPSGAVIRDILHRLEDRFPREVIVWPVAVQGQACAPSVARAIEGFNRLGTGAEIPRPDVLIVARGGGSVEDLWGFNEEIVARAAAASQIPIISAIGHETDTTLLDYVADRRAPTPTAAAEIAVPVRRELVSTVTVHGERLARWAEQSLLRMRQRLVDVARALPQPAALFDRPRQRLEGLGRALPAALRSEVQLKRTAFAHAAAGVKLPTLATRIASRRVDLGSLGARLGLSAARIGKQSGEELARVAGRLRPAFGRTVREHGERLAGDRGRLIEAIRRLGIAQTRAARDRRDRLAALERMRQSLGYAQTLARGYAVVWGEQGVVTTAAAALEEDALEIEFRDGRMRPGTESVRGARPGRKKVVPPEGQGSLF